MARGFVTGQYISDIFGGQGFTTKVEQSKFGQTAALGWTADPGGLFGLPRNLRPRHAVGVDASGRRHSTRIADPTATVWTRAATSWTGIDDTGAAFTATVTGLVGEAVSFV